MSRNIWYTSIPRDGLVAEYLLDWNANDTSGNWNDGTATDVSWVSADRGYVKEVGDFNGSSSYVDIPSSVCSNLWTTFTVDITVNLSTTLSSEIWRRRYNNTNISIKWTGNENELRLWIYDGSAWQEAVLSIELNKYEKLSMVSDANNSVMKIYKNGTLFEEKTNISFGNSNNDWIAIWAYADWSVDHSDWQIWLVRIYNRALNQSEIKNLYQEWLRRLWPTRSLRVNNAWVWSLPNLERGKVLEISKPQSWWTYYDQTGNGNDGTATDVTDSTVGLANVMSFNGSSSYVDTSFIFPNWTTTNFSISMWFKTSVSWAEQELINNYGWLDSANHFELVTGTTDNLSFWLDDWISYNSTQVDASDYLDGNYHNITITRDRINKKIYADNTLLISESYSWDVDLSERAIDIARRNDGLRYFDWQIWLTRIYNRALSATEIQQLYYSQKPNFI